MQHPLQTKRNSEKGTADLSRQPNTRFFPRIPSLATPMAYHNSGVVSMRLKYVSSAVYLTLFWSKYRQIVQTSPWFPRSADSSGIIFLGNKFVSKLRWYTKIQGNLCQTGSHSTFLDVKMGQPCVFLILDRIHVWRLTLYFVFLKMLLLVLHTGIRKDARCMSELFVSSLLIRQLWKHTV